MHNCAGKRIINVVKALRVVKMSEERFQALEEKLAFIEMANVETVSYTHLTLPTNREV